MQSGHLAPHCLACHLSLSCASLHAWRVGPGCETVPWKLCFPADGQQWSWTFILELQWDAGRKGVPCDAPGTEISALVVLHCQLS